MHVCSLKHTDSGLHRLCRGCGSSSPVMCFSMDAYQGLIDKEERAVRLRERREKLRRQLEEERALLAVGHFGAWHK